MMQVGSIRTVDLRGLSFDSQSANNLVPRAQLDISKAMAEILPILEDVKNNGEQAIIRSALKFDEVDPSPIRVSAKELEDAVANLDPKLRAAIVESISRVKKVSAASLPAGNQVSLGDGAEVRLRWQPVDSVGLYVPGGKAVYPSSVIMNVVPAQTAGVERLALATPAQKLFGGRPHPTVLATAALLGVKDVYCMGGPSAIAAFAYGLPEIELEAVSLITGPGNIYVAAAKRFLRGTVGIDSEAGTTEILIIADSSANPRFIAADLISQAEHDEAAAAVLVTDSSSLAESVRTELELLLPKTQNSTRAKTALLSQQSAVVLVDDIASAVRFANFYATEHLEIHTRENEKVLQKISNAGAIFLGEFSPVSLGDYLAGSNHVLPTGQQAKFGSGLGVHTFLRAQQVVEYDRSGLEKIASKAVDFSEAEGLPAHGQAITTRFEH
jgi:histidinol dehydrogenase